MNLKPINIDDLINKDITIHTSNHKYRGILLDCEGGVLFLQTGIDALYVTVSQVEAITHHGVEQRPADLNSLTIGQDTSIITRNTAGGVVYGNSLDNRTYKEERNND